MSCTDNERWVYVQVAGEKLAHPQLEHVALSDYWQLEHLLSTFKVSTGVGEYIFISSYK